MKDLVGILDAYMVAQVAPPLRQLRGKCRENVTLCAAGIFAQFKTLVKTHSIAYIHVRVNIRMRLSRIVGQL